jgi:hypothetical protein
MTVLLELSLINALRQIKSIVTLLSQPTDPHPIYTISNNGDSHSTTGTKLVHDYCVGDSINRQRGGYRYTVHNSGR